MPEIYVDALTWLSSVILYLLLAEPRFSMKKNLVAGIAGGGLLAAFFSYVRTTGLFTPMAVGLGATLSSLAVLRFLSKQGGGRFLFTFLSLNVFSLVVFCTAQQIYLLTGQFFLYPLCLAVGHFLMYCGVWWIRRSYQSIQRSSKTGWSYLTVAAFLFYVMLFLCAVNYRAVAICPAFLMLAIFFCLCVIMVYVVMTQYILQMRRNCEFQRDERLLRAQLDLKSSQLEVQQLYYRLAYVDTMTGLKNRTAFEERKQELQQGWSTLCPAACICMDMNNLKKTNDQLGHLAGDKLIQGGAAVLRSVFYGQEEVYRIGGDEFLVILCNTSPESAWTAYHRILSEVDRYNERHRIEIDMAIGMETTDASNPMSFSDLFDSADKKMYEHKQKEKQIK